MLFVQAQPFEAFRPTEVRAGFLPVFERAQGCPPSARLWRVRRGAADAPGSAPEAMLKSSRVQDLISDGIVELDGASLAVTDDSRFLVRSEAAAFDAHLNGSKQLHGRAV